MSPDRQPHDRETTDGGRARRRVVAPPPGRRLWPLRQASGRRLGCMPALSLCGGKKGGCGKNNMRSIFVVGKIGCEEKQYAINLFTE